MQFYSYQEFDKDVISLSQQIKNEFDPDAILAIARGGLTLGHFLAEHLSLRNLFVLNSIHYDDQEKLDYIKIFNIPDLSQCKKVVIVDDIIDSGETMMEITKTLQEQFPQTEFKTAAIYFKEKSLMLPDFCSHEAHDWIEFFWSKSDN
jgi:xanthine phosphoribosyltransferase